MSDKAARTRRRRGSPRIFGTVRERIAWSYANLARAHAALGEGRSSYSVVDHMIRAKLFSGLCGQTMAIRSIFDDERHKMNEAPHCVYCGVTDRLVIDHLIARSAGGPDDGANLVRACLTCNSGKRERDMIVWLAASGRFPSLLLYRRYLKVVVAMVHGAGLLDAALDDERLTTMPFDVAALPAELPPLSELRITAV